MVRTNEEAIDAVARQSATGKPFKVGMCKQRTRMAYGVPSDGSNDATEAFGRTKHRLAVTGAKAPRGAILWWTGGSKGHGHVAIADGKGGVWSVDIKRNGFWDHVPFGQIAKSFPNVKFAGVSQDIDGVRVIGGAAARTTTLSLPKKRLATVRDKYRNNRVIDLKVLDAYILSGANGAKTVKLERDRIEAAIQRLIKTVK